LIDDLALTSAAGGPTGLHHLGKLSPTSGANPTFLAAFLFGGFRSAATSGFDPSPTCSGCGGDTRATCSGKATATPAPGARSFTTTGGWCAWGCGAGGSS